MEIKKKERLLSWWVKYYKTDEWCRVQMFGATLKLWSPDTDVQSQLYQNIIIKNDILALDRKTEVILNTAQVHFWRESIY